MNETDEMVRVTLIMNRRGDIWSEVKASGQVSPPIVHTLVAGMAARLMHNISSGCVVEPKQ